MQYTTTREKPGHLIYILEQPNGYQGLWGPSGGPRKGLVESLNLKVKRRQEKGEDAIICEQKCRK